MPICPRTLNEVSPHLRQMFEHGKQAIVQRNHAYAFQILRQALQAEPGFIEARIALRQAQLERIGNKASVFRRALAFLLSAWGVFVKGPSLLKKGQVLEALDLAEKTLQLDPTLITSAFFFVRVALEAKLIAPALNTLEVAVRFNPKNRKALRRLASLYSKAGDDGRALEILQRLCTLRPNDLSLQSELRQTTAMAAMKQGKWDRADSFRDIIKDPGRAVLLEQKERIAPRDSDALRQLIEAAEADLAGQDNAANHKRLADLYRRAHEFDKALEHYNAVLDKTGTLDPTIDRIISEVMSQRYDEAIAKWRQYADANPEKHDEAVAQIAELEKQKDEIVFSRLRERVQRYPNDALFRFELAEALWKRKAVDEALGEFQRAARNPQLRPRAMVWMGRCLAEKGLYDLAIERFREPLQEPGPMDDDRKECLYCLAHAYEETGQTDQALEALKRIYAVDVNYRDISKRIEAYYRARK
ncbi:MAG: tetratricopeptide repeat protein [Kiritimatiellaeota bacterium]|nr:tetratricopeptide repeat protein [Kiritimatiellota bacterium]